jgi:hypothetical protein
MEQHVSATVDQTSRFEQLLADLKITSGDLTEVPQQLADVTQAGFEASTSTIAVAGQHSSGAYSVQLNNQNGGLPSPGRNGPSNSPRRRCCRNSAQRAESLEAVTRSGGREGQAEA